MSIKPTPAFNGGDGRQLRDTFRAINAELGSEVVTNIHKIMNTRLRHPYRASGRQLRTAFEQINTYVSLEIVNPRTIQNICDGRQLKLAFEALQKWRDGLPVWAELPDVNVPQGGTWDLLLTDYVIGDEPMTFSLSAGKPPTGISLNPDGSFSGTVTNALGAGTALFSATNSRAEVESGNLSWTIPPPPPLIEMVPNSNQEGSLGITHDSAGVFTVDFGNAKEVG